MEVPARYAREITARERLLEQCPIDVYVAGVCDRYSWPWRLVAANEADRPGLRESCETLIVDSVYSDPYYPVGDVLEAAHAVDADYVVSKDYPDEPRTALDAHGRFLSLWRRHKCDAEPIPVLSTHDLSSFRGQCRHYARREDDVGTVAVGGLRDARGAVQVRYFREARKVLGYDVDLHGLGVGTSTELIGALQESIADDSDRPLIDSFDISTPENAVRNNKLADKRWSQHRCPLPEGTDSTTVRAGFAEATARMLAYELTTGCDESFSQDGTLTPDV
ncbi:hypothetical protein [Natronococcus jeotgali]|uniref:Uncharacterized protein n=1 Tax=Natronococcus jeotgali DSM 18795 TaxID=1227498 RepID=L9XAE9_9EURY|nr:hypothetical protein [Natronococcus jeotgali]ELY58729.1 hypothetical protein C492_11590 [Natronococcus jeotgali DSM 18795]